MDQTLRVLIADDSVVMRERLTAMISQLPKVEVVGVAQDVPETLAQTRALRPDVLVLDLRMPRQNGLVALKELRQKKDETFVIVFTNLAEPVYRDRALAAGANRFLSKASQFQELESELRELVARR